MKIVSAKLFLDFGIECVVCFNGLSSCERMNRRISDANTVAHIKLSFTKTFQTNTFKMSRLAWECTPHTPRTTMSIWYFYSILSREQAQSQNQNVVDVNRVLLSFIRSIWNFFSRRLFSLAIIYLMPKNNGPLYKHLLLLSFSHIDSMWCTTHQPQHH